MPYAAPPDERARPDPVRRGLRRGFIGGAAIVLVALVGMVEDFAKRKLVAGIDQIGPPVLLDLGQVIWLGGFILIGAIAAREMRQFGRDRPPSKPALLAGTLAGAAAGACVGLLLLVGATVKLGAVFVQARPALYGLLSLGGLEAGEFRDVGIGAVLILAAWRPVIAGALGGLIGAASMLLPHRWRRALIVATLTMLVFGIIQDLLQKIDFIRRTSWLQQLTDVLYTRRTGLRLGGAITIFAAAFGWDIIRQHLGRVRDERLALMPAARRRSMSRLWRGVSLALVAAFLIWFPFGFGRYPADVFDLIGIYILMGLGLNIVVGFAGLLDLGYVAFFAIGAYTMGVFTSAGPPSGQPLELSFWQALPVVLVFTILAGVMLGVPVLKTHGDYLAIITLGFGEIIRILAISDALKPIMGGAQGITLIPKPLSIPEIYVPLVGRLNPGVQQEIFFPILGGVIVAAYVSWRLRNSRFGRAWMAVREDEHVAEAMGINLVNTKLLAFATGAAFAGVAGALFASKLGSIYPSSFGLLVSINVLVLIIVGGMGSIPGVFVGALALVGLPELLREFDDFRMLLYGAVLVIMMLNRPEGLWPASIIRRELHRGDDNEPSAMAQEPVDERRGPQAAAEIERQSGGAP